MRNSFIVILTCLLLVDKHLIVKEILYTVLFQQCKHAFDRLGYSACL